MRGWVAGFLLPGVLLGPLGALLIAWQYHIHTDPETAGLHFLALNTGYVLAAGTAQRVLTRASVRSVAFFACGIGFASLVTLSFLAPPVPALWRLIGLGFVATAAGALVTVLLYVLEPFFADGAPAAMNLCVLLFNCGCLLATVIVDVMYFVGPVHLETMALSAIPLVYFVIYAINRNPIAIAWAVGPYSAIREKVIDLRSTAGVLCALLLFFQFGSEWSIVGWLPLFLIHRLGTSPERAILAMAVYFLVLIAGRVSGRPLLSKVKRRRLLVASLALTIFGYLLLSLADSLGGACLAIVLIGAGFSPIYPLLARNLDERFSYDPRFYNGMISLAITGGMSAAWLVGYVDSWFGMQYAMLVPALGSVVVFALTLLVMLEARVMRG